MSEATTQNVQAYPKLLSLAVHEFRSPASVVGGYLRMLQSGVAGDLSDQQRHMVAEAEKSCARMVDLLAELSDIGKLDSGLMSLNEVPVDLFQLINEVANNMHEGQDREVELHLQGDVGGVPVVGDRTRLYGALSVLMRAILREQRPKTTVVVDKRLVETGDGLRATIVVAPEESLVESRAAAPAPFDEFRGGLGLGLPLARRIIERYGGRVWTPALPDQKRSGLVVSVPVKRSDRSEGR